MKKTPIYAVVDLETTGTDPQVDRMIQFGCVLVQDGKIIGDFSTDINPQQAIPKRIVHLTKITNQRVSKAPPLEDIAETLYQLLDGCVFVAHNVHFDYQFLKEELVRCGQPALSIDAIDTVELVQIFYPTLSSFRLTDIAQQLSLSHDRPHQADSDAYVTAEILLKTIEKMDQLPMITLKKIASLAEVCTMQTGAFISAQAKKREQKPQVLDSNIEVIHQIALCKKEKQTAPSEESIYKKFPISKIEKEKIFTGTLQYIPSQAKLMNQIYRFYQEEENDYQNLGIEAPTGMGKTLGYLFPLSYLITKEEPAIVATSTLLLQQQLMKEIEQRLLPIAPKQLTAVEVKSKKHFLNLERFEKTLRKKKQQKAYHRYQMAVLTWLTETQTGDLTEIHHLLNDHAFWNEIRYQPQDQIDTASDFYTVDFWRHLLDKIGQVDLIVTNQAFLCEENHRSQPILPQSKYLLIDEAHSLSKVLMQLGTRNASYYQIQKCLTTLSQWEDSFLSVIHKEHIVESQLLTQFYEKIEKIKEIYAALEQSLFEQLIRLQQKEIQEEWYSDTTNQFLDDESKQLSEQLLQELALSSRLLVQLQSQLDRLTDRWTLSEQQNYHSWLQSLHFLAEWQEWLPGYFHDWSDRFIKWFRKDSQQQHLDFYQLDLQELQIAHSKWYTRYEKIIYISGTLRTGKKTCLLAEELQIPNFHLKTVGHPFDYRHQAKLLLPTFSNDWAPKDAKYTESLCEFLTKLIQQANRSTMVLFTSRQLLQEVYEQTEQVAQQCGRELLAQHISGSNEKIMKRFFQSRHAILYGTSAFWDGVDFPKESLEILVITRLPFDVPQQPIAKARQKYYLAKGKNPFTAFFLPKAILRLKQGVGRLIRSQEDRGILIVTDNRLWKKRYGKQILNNLPKDLPVQTCDEKELFEEITTFFKKE